MQHISSLSKVIELVKSNDIIGIEILNVGLADAYVAECSLHRNKTVFDHLWSFINDASRLSPYSKIKVKVSHIVPIVTHTRSICIFVVENTRDAIIKRPITSNCCFPEFLSSSYQNCGGTFEAVGKATAITIPVLGELAYGCGISKSTANGKLVSPISIYVNGDTEKYQITHW